MKCPFCKKELKTQSGFDKHMCEKKSRYVNFDVLAFFVWKCWNKFVGLKLGADEEKNKLRFINSREYKDFVSFSKYLEDVNPYDCSDFVKYLVRIKLPVNKWTGTKVYHNWVLDFEKREGKEVSIVRSKKFIESQNIDIKNISESRLYNYLYNGRISPWYIDYVDRNLFFKMENDLLAKLKDIIEIIVK